MQKACDRKKFRRMSNAREKNKETNIEKYLIISVGKVC